MLYRFISEHHGLEALQTRIWKVGRILELNDPLDCRPVIIKDGKPLGHSDPIPISLRKIYENLGIICYSEAMEDTVMWSHYGHIHAGIALGFDFLQCPPHQVQYPEDNKRSRIDVDALPANYLTAEASVEEIGKHFLLKAHGWSYEREYRHFIPLNQCEMKGLHYFTRLPMENLLSVVIGMNARCSARDIKQLLCPPSSDVREHFTEVKICKAKIDLEHYRVVPDEADLSEFELE